MRKPPLDRKAPLRPVKPPFLKGGKPPAKSPKTVAHNSSNRNHSKGDKSNWGGKRNYVKFSEYLTRSDVEKIRAAALDAALALKRPLNLFVTINWGKYAIEDEYALVALQAFLGLVFDWLRTQGIERVYLWVREIGRAVMGSHAHILLHCPGHVRVALRFRRWLRIVTGQTYKKGGVQTRRIGRTSNCFQTNPNLYLANLQTVVGYIAKGVDPDVASELGIREPVYSGGIVGKRCNLSYTLSRALNARVLPCRGQMPKRKQTA